MAQAANDIKKQLKEYAFERYEAAWFLQLRVSARKANIPAFSFSFHNALDVITPNEAAEIAGCNLKKAVNLLSGREWTRGASDTVFGLPLYHTIAFWEIKTANDTPSGEQLLFLEIMRRFGYIADIITDNVEDDIDHSIARWQMRQRE